jgi:hypothetical protein
MAIDLYQPFTNPITRETFRCISSTEEAFTMEWTVHPGGYVPFEHVHVNQDEIFHIQQGEMRVKVKGITQVGKAGEVLTIPHGLTLDCDYDKRGLVNFAKVMFMLRKVNALSLTRPAFAPDWLFQLGMHTFFMLGSVMRWETLYKKYTE